MLDLKFVVHCGQYAAHVVAGREELIGYDVILVHRLLKNRVADEIGTRGYALLTMSAIEELGLQQFAQGLIPMLVSVDGTDLDVRVLDLAARWRELQRTMSVADDPEVEVWADVEAPPAEIWRIMASATERPNWISVSTGVEQRPSHHSHPSPIAVADGFAPMSPQVAEAWRQRSQADVDRLAHLVATRLCLRKR